MDSIRKKLYTKSKIKKTVSKVSFNIFNIFNLFIIHIIIKIFI